MDLLKLLEIIATGGGALWVAYKIIENWPWALGLDPEPRQWAASIIAGVCGALAWVLQMGLGVHAQPTTWQGWATALGGAAILAGWLAEKVHARTKLSKFMRDDWGARIEKPPPYNLHH